MTSNRASLVVGLGFGLVLALAPAAHAQATRTWVSGVGDDANPCSRTAPCKTFAGAISKTADGGYINALDPGGFGGVTIVKSITIEGVGTHAGILVAGAGVNGIVINSATAKVTLRNLTIESPSVTGRANDAIRVLAAAEVHVENVWIGNFAGDAVEFNPSGTGAEGFFKNVTLQNNSGGGIVVLNGRVTVDGLVANSNDSGVIVRGNAIATVRNSYAAGGSVGFGATLVNSAVINVENCTTTHNANGIFANSGATARVSNSMIVSNVTFGLFNGGAGSTIISLSGNTVTGNPTDGVFSGAALPKQ